MGKFDLKHLQKLREEKKGEVHKRPEKGEIIIGMATCGIAAGAKETKAAIEDELKKHGLDTTVLVRSAGCLGFCYAEPTVEVRMAGLPYAIYGDVDTSVARQIVQQHIIGKKILEEHAYDKPADDVFEKYTLDRYYSKTPGGRRQVRFILRNCGVIDPESIDEYLARDGYAALEKVLFSMTPDQVMEELKKSGLRGRGGAYFPTWKKWEFTRQVTSDKKYIICNADEGDPGAYMNRSTLEGDPHSIIEAMAIAGRTLGADQGYIYVRAEYPLAVYRLEKAIEQARNYGLLGNDILHSGFNFEIDIRLGAGAFVCGEETALIASVEGQRGMPRTRPPFPAVKGLWGKPTVINNVSTLASIPLILLKGGDWYAGVGAEAAKGTAVFALTGKVKHSGLVEVPLGTTLRDIVFDLGGGTASGKAFKAIQTGGPSGGVIPADYLDTPVEPERLQALGSIMGSGGMIIMDEDDCMVDVAKFYLNFSVDESCGKCAPCRIGTRTLYNMVDAISSGKGKKEDLSQIKILSRAMQKASLCGLGQCSPNPVLSTLRYFEPEYLAHIEERRCPAGKCKELVIYAIDPVKCIGCGACARHCPVGCISGEKRKPHTIDAARCIRCGECFRVCKFGAVSRN